MSYTDGSVSKGVFVHRGKRKQADAGDYIHENNQIDDALRYDLCSSTWEVINDRVQILQSDSNTKIFEDLLSFVKCAYSGEKKTTSGYQGRQEIPTAALVTGVNSPDHAVMFYNLKTLLKERLTPFVAELRAKDCFNVRAIVSKAVSELMGSAHVLDESLNEDHPNLKRINPTISLLARWYQDKLQTRSPKKNQSPRKRKANSSPVSQPTSVSSFQEVSSPPVVFILEDLEAFSPNVLQDFITMCSNHLSDLPVVLVFGIATSVTAVHRLLSNAASSLLCMEKFQAPPSSEYLSLVIDQVVMTDDIAFKLGPKVFNLLLDIFLFHDFSVLNFVRGIQFALLDHFYTHQYSIVCSEPSKAKDTISKMTDKQLKSVQELQSYQEFLEKRNSKGSPLKTSKDIKKVLTEMISDLNDYHSCFFPVLRCLHAFAVKFPNYPLGKQVRELYARSISSNICDTPEYQESLTLMKSLSRDELLQLLNECYNNLQSRTLDKKFKEIREKLTYYIEKFGNIEALQKEFDEEREAAASEEVAIPEKTNLYNLKQKLQSMEMKKKKLSVYETLRNELVDYLDVVFRTYIKPPTTLPLHEIFYYNNISELRHHISGSPRSTIQWGLADPYHYLQNDSLKADGDTILSTHPDVCIAYKLHLECGRLINLYDWLQAFMTITSAVYDDLGSPKKSRTAKKPDLRVLQARFIRAVSELQFLGFIKPTKRKTDHVARLTWGGC